MISRDDRSRPDVVFFVRLYRRLLPSPPSFGFGSVAVVVDRYDCRRSRPRFPNARNHTEGDEFVPPRRRRPLRLEYRRRGLWQVLMPMPPSSLSARVKKHSRDRDR